MPHAYKLQISCVQISKSMRKVISGVQGVQIAMGLDIVQDACWADWDRVMAVALLQGMVLYVALQSAESIVHRPIERSPTNFVCVGVRVDK